MSSNTNIFYNNFPRTRSWVYILRIYNLHEPSC
uniref:Uncharacterized protein n=1 Tax=Arundo donax TaxID=35708 RepID=A0A0A9ENC0_ARUDO